MIRSLSISMNLFDSFSFLVLFFKFFFCLILTDDILLKGLTFGTQTVLYFHGIVLINSIFFLFL